MGQCETQIAQRPGVNWTNRGFTKFSATRVPGKAGAILRDDVVKQAVAMGASLKSTSDNTVRLAYLAPNRVHPSYFCRVVEIKGSQDIKWKA